MQLSGAPLQLVLPWANGDATKTNPVPVPSQIGVTPGAASWTDGYPPLCATPVSSGGVPPSKADMNGGLYQMSAVDVWMCAGAGFPYSSVFSAAIGGYPKGALVLQASGTGYWISTVDNNTTDPDTGGSGWGQFGSASSGAGLQLLTYSATPVCDAAHFATFEITLTGDAAPTISGQTAGQLLTFIIHQDGTGGHNWTWPGAVFGGGAIDPDASSTSTQSFRVSSALNIYAIGGIVG